MSETIGLLAATLTTLSFLPQAIKVLRTGNTDGISLTMYILFTVGLAAWLAYGLVIGSLPVIIANAVTLVFAVTILTLKIRAVRRARLEAHYAG